MTTRVARVLSVNVGTVREFEYNGRRGKSAIWKSPVAGRIAARGVNLDGDAQADRRAHVRSFVRTWTAELKDRGIRVNAISPGAIDTPIIDSQAAHEGRRGCDPGEVRSGDLTFLVNDWGRPFSDAGFGNKFRDWCNQAGLRHCSAHGLRKAGATMAACNGATSRQLMAIFG